MSLFFAVMVLLRFIDIGFNIVLQGNSYTTSFAMMIKIYWLTFFSFFFIATYAQKSGIPSIDTVSHDKFLTIVNYNKEQSYVSFGKGIGNQLPILFEAQLSPSYFVSRHHKKWALMMNPQVQIRMLNQASLPIQVPSYHFYLTYYHSIEFWRQTFLKKLFYEDALWFASVVHHSNGQSGSYYLNDTTKAVNLTSGNFSVNFIQLGVTSYTLKHSGNDYFSLREIKINTEIYPYKWCDSDLKGNFGFYRLFGAFSFGGPSRQDTRQWVNRWLQNSSIEMKAGWIFGAYRGFGSYEASKRLIIDVTYKYYPPWFDEIAFFVRFYRGQDYYNIYFEKELNNLTVGITSSTIRLSNGIKYLGNSKKRTAANR